MIRLLASPITSMLLGGLSFLLTLFFLLERPLQTAALPLEPTEEEMQTGFWERHNPEIDQLLEELRREKKELDRRATDLEELEKRLAAERAEINQITERVAQLQLEFDQHVVRVREEETPNLKRLAKIYTTMTPEGVRAIFRELDDEVIVKLLSFMKEDQSAPLLEAIARGGEAQAKRAAAISESLRTTLGEKRKTP